MKAAAMDNSKSPTHSDTKPISLKNITKNTEVKKRMAWIREEIREVI
jgi:hypothetical protein